MAPERKPPAAASAVGTDDLVRTHIGLVKAIAARIKQSLTAPIEMDDLVGWGSKGLVEAASRFDPGQGHVFSTFAYYRIRGAIYDGLRGYGWYSRAAYGRFRAEERANEYMQSHADRDAAARAASPGETAGAEQGEALEQVAEILSGIAIVHVASLEAAAHVADERLQPPEDLIDGARMGVRVRQAIETLPEKERRLMQLYYFEGKNLETAGAELGLSKSWACRLHARAVDLLRDVLADAA